jgi:hypothetical protein
VCPRFGLTTSLKGLPGYWGTAQGLKMNFEAYARKDANLVWAPSPMMSAAVGVL